MQTLLLWGKWEILHFKVAEPNENALMLQRSVSNNDQQMVYHSGAVFAE